VFPAIVEIFRPIPEEASKSEGVTLAIRALRPLVHVAEDP